MMMVSPRATGSGNTAGLTPWSPPSTPRVGGGEAAGEDGKSHPASESAADQSAVEAEGREAVQAEPQHAPAPEPAADQREKVDVSPGPSGARRDSVFDVEAILSSGAQMSSPPLPLRSSTGAAGRVRSGRATHGRAGEASPIDVVATLGVGGGEAGLCTLSEASEFGDARAVKRQIACGGSPSATLPGKARWTALHRAVDRGRAAVVRELLVGGADPNAPTGAGGDTPLHIAASHPGTPARVLTDLVHAGANVNTPNKCGWTPLHAAMFSGNEAAVRVLLHHGADRGARDKRNLTPPELAHDARRVDMTDFAAQAQNGRLSREWRRTHARHKTYKVRTVDYAGACAAAERDASSPVLQQLAIHSRRTAEEAAAARELSPGARRVEVRRPLRPFRRPF
jgi:hypothetical protein